MIEYKTLQRYANYQLRNASASDRDDCIQEAAIVFLETGDMKKANYKIMNHYKKINKQKNREKNMDLCGVSYSIGR